MGDFLWIGNNISDQIKERILQNGQKIMSGSVSEKNILTGLYANDVYPDSINAYRFIPYPHGDFYCDREIWSDDSKNVNISCAYCNLKFLRVFFRTRALKKEARKWAKENQNLKPEILVYSMHSPFLKAAVEIKKIVPNAKITLIVLDLPQYMDMAMSPIKKVLKKLDWISIKRLMKKIDKFVLYAKPMADFLKLEDGQWIVMEGSYNSDLTVQEDAIEDNGKISVMYSGVLDMRYGIPELLDAFELLDDNYELWLTGNGNAVPFIKERAEKDKRIKFYGYLPSRQDLINKQASATMLISPRRDAEEGSKYCFPSKLFEYMVSGNPVISCFLAGIPEEYHKHLVELKTVTPECIAETIKSVAEMESSNRKILGNGAKQFVLENKNKVAQAKKILEFLK